MAAMFQAQSANWEETQEKMSQFVAPLGVFYLYSSLRSNQLLFLFFLTTMCTLALNELPSILAGLAGVVNQAVASHIKHSRRRLPTAHFRRAMSVIDVVKKVCIDVRCSAPSVF